MLQIWLDDERDAPDYTWKVFRRAQSLMEFLVTNKEDIAVISFDHDLGDGVPTGYDVASFIEERVAAGTMKAPLSMRVHSANPAGSRRISQAIESIIRLDGLTSRGS